MADDVRRWSDELAREPGSLVFLQLGEALRRQQQLDLAHKIALRGLERHPHNADAHDLLARIAVDRRDFARALDEWNAVLRLVPGHVGALKGLGYLSFQQGRVDDAERYLTGAAATDEPSVASALRAVRHASGNYATIANQPADPVYVPPRAVERSASVCSPTLLVDEGQTALLLDASGLRAGRRVHRRRRARTCRRKSARSSAASRTKCADRRDISTSASGGRSRSRRAATVVAMAPSEDGGLLVVAASQAHAAGTAAATARPVRGAGLGVAPERRVRREAAP